MAVQIEIREDSVLACLSGEIDHHSAVELREQIDQSVIQSGAKLLVLDFFTGHLYGLLGNRAGDGALSVDAGK